MVHQFQISPQIALPIYFLAIGNSAAILRGETLVTIVVRSHLPRSTWSNSARRKIGQLLAPCCSDSKHRWQRHDFLDNRNVTPQIAPRRVATIPRATSGGQ
jgi:hypothetical protein